MKYEKQAKSATALKMNICSNMFLLNCKLPIASKIPQENESPDFISTM